ncbi:MAG: ATP-binding cassette domain-containing protein [Oscillospiraceae bacterium]|nr:ATP-binding cassette domain-containing protein [Oscillospiraceae bacterium]
MSKLKLTDIQKTYRNGEIVHALKGVSLEFRENEFVAVFGPSGCGKTTLLNIIGGLDRYDSGDIELGGLSTRNFRDADWDAYRNRSIGFVFQSYNLIGHQTVLQNVEIAMTLSGVSAGERRRRAKEALASVGLSDQMKKRPNQLSGGQMQRVAIARALVNNPEIILADEPTGALDSHTSVQVMEILKEIAKTKLVIVVTHNSDLAEKYSNRIIRLLDGELQSDTNPPPKDGTARESGGQAAPVNKKGLRKTSMSVKTATTLSFKNLLTKKGRTITTAIAGSIGIIGVALVLALSSGLSGYMTQMQRESLSGLPISISEATQAIERGHGMEGGNPILGRSDESGKYTDNDILYRYDRSANIVLHQNVLTPEYFDYIAKVQSELPDAVSAVSYARAVEINLLAKGNDSVVKFATVAGNGNGGGGAGSGMGEMFGGGGLYWQEMDGNEELILSLYDLVGEGSRLPKEKDEVALVVDEYNRIDKAFFEKLGIFTDTDSYKLTDFIGKTILKVIPNDAYYTQTADGIFAPAPVSEYGELYGDGDGIALTITGTLRIKENTASLTNYLSTGLVYTTALTDFIVDNAQQSEIAAAQMNSDFDVNLNTPFASDDDKRQKLLQLGADTTPTGISVYPKDYAGKDAIKEYLDAYNEGRSEKDQIVYTDIAQIVESMIGIMLNTVTLVLIAFAAISLVVSTIMIAIIIYVSVIERTKEIGILRSVGARKKDISRVFNAEAVLIGMVAGLIGIGATYLLQMPINSIVSSLAGVDGIAGLPFLYAVMLVLGSMGLTLIAGFVPSKKAAKKDPVVALRTE